jgi:exopolysaccharide biosynthesis protein
LENHPEEPVNSFNFSKAEPWDVDDALHAGPVLMHDGKIRVTSDEEVFFGSTIPNIHPRTAAGYRISGELVLLVVDGRQVSSRGVDLQELAILMKDLGCVEAINLDGGGSRWPIQ